MSDEHTSDADAALLQLTRDVRAELAHSLDSLGGKESKGAFDKFLFYSAGQMNKAAEAYILLREGGRVDASKLLVRPLIEMMFRTCAVGAKPALFYRVILTERLKRNKWIENAAKRQKTKHDPTEEALQWQVFRQHCVAMVPETDLTNEALSVRDVAVAANMEPYYQGFYAMYCTYTHGAFEAVTGTLDPLSDAYDNRTAALTIFSAVEVLRGLGGESPNFESLRKRLQL